jgi:hypothetical protein
MSTFCASRSASSEADDLAIEGAALARLITSADRPADDVRGEPQLLRALP